MSDDYELFLKSKQDEIRQRVLGKYGVKNNDIGAQPKRGRVKNEKMHLICTAFNMNIATLNMWRREDCKAGRQRLYALLMAMPFDVLEYIAKMEIKE